MTYKGYELRNDAKTIFHKDGEIIEVEAWGIYANGDYKGSAKTLDAAKQYIDGIGGGYLHRAKDRTVIQRTDYDGRGRVIRTTYYGGKK